MKDAEELRARNVHVPSWKILYRGLYNPLPDWFREVLIADWGSVVKHPVAFPCLCLFCLRARCLIFWFCEGSLFLDAQHIHLPLSLTDSLTNVIHRISRHQQYATHLYVCHSCNILLPFIFHLFKFRIHHFKPWFTWEAISTARKKEEFLGFAVVTPLKSLLVKISFTYWFPTVTWHGTERLRVRHPYSP